MLLGIFSTLSVTILSRSIAFSFHLKRSATLKIDEKAFAAGISPDPAGGEGELTTLPEPVGWGGGHSLP